MTTLEILQRARTRLSKRECWIKGSFQFGDRYCLLGACSDREVSGTSMSTTPEVIALLKEAIRDGYGHVFNAQVAKGSFQYSISIVQFNDSYARYEDIIAVLDDAIKRTS
jgi:hypothetical protein